jgi:hypothetical protein
MKKRLILGAAMLGMHVGAIAHADEMATRCPNKTVLRDSVKMLLKADIPGFSFMDGDTQWEAFSIVFYPSAPVKVDREHLDRLDGLEISYVIKQNDDVCTVYFHPKNQDVSETSSLKLEVAKR